MSTYNSQLPQLVLDDYAIVQALMKYLQDAEIYEDVQFFTTDTRLTNQQKYTINTTRAQWKVTRFTHDFVLTRDTKTKCRKIYIDLDMLMPLI